jgi:hypothetical protein
MLKKKEKQMRIAETSDAELKAARKDAKLPKVLISERRIKQAAK